MHYPDGDVCRYRGMRFFAAEYSGEFAHSMETAGLDWFALGEDPDLLLCSKHTFRPTGASKRQAAFSSFDREPL